MFDRFRRVGSRDIGRGAVRRRRDCVGVAGAPRTHRRFQVFDLVVITHVVVGGKDYLILVFGVAVIE
jgi:hypothetical protein